jgi:FkbM family methyltransferase
MLASCLNGRLAAKSQNNLKFSGLIQRLRPLTCKLAGRLPLCPWRSVLFPLNPRLLGVMPPALDIQEITTDGAFKKLRFGGRHEAWFPANVAITPDMWGEYLCVFWDHPKNAHYYLRHTPVKTGDVCVDCGACEGFFVFQALEAGAAKVICVEAGKVMVECLARTFEKEIVAGRVVVKHAALGALNGTTRFNFDSLNPFGGSVSLSSDQGDTVNVRTLEQLLDELAVSRIDFLKMDIEGAEIQAVEGALPVLRRDHPRLAITTYHRQFDYAALSALARASGYGHIKPVGIAAQDAGGNKVYCAGVLHAWQ